MAKIQGTELVRVPSSSRLRFANDRQEYVSKAITRLNNEGKRIINIIDGPITNFGPLGNVYCDITILWEADTDDPKYKTAPISTSSNTGSGSSGGGCYVATAVYGSYDCPQVWTLRRYRDNTLAETWYGRAFIHTYYAVSPTLVKWFGHTEWFKKLWRGKLDKMVSKLQEQGIESTPYKDREW